jgi:hypothetical protein
MVASLIGRWGGALAPEDVPVATSNREQLAKDLDRLCRQWHQVRLTGFHAARGDIPLSTVQIDLRPLGGT